MARSLRIDFESAYHHITSRIINRAFWMKSVKIKQLFYDTLIATSLKFDTKIIAYTIMDNHFHLIIQTKKTSISKFMHTLLTSFAKKYNYITKRKGHVFESRFQSFLIEKESYLRSAIKYVLTNPVRAKIVKKADAYKWSSCDKYFKISKFPMDNIATKEIINIFNSKEAFYEYMEITSEEKIHISPSRTNRVQLYGSKSYLEKIITLYIKEKRSQQRKIAHISEQLVLQFIETQYQIQKSYLLNPEKRQDKLKARRVFAYLTKKYCHLSLFEIGNHIGVCSSTVSVMIKKIITNVLEIRKLELEFSKFLY